MNLQNLQVENDILLMTKTMDNMAKEMKMIQPLDLKQKSLTVCSCHVTYAFPSESALYSCLNVKELLARSRREI